FVQPASGEKTTNGRCQFVVREFDTWRLGWNASSFPFCKSRKPVCVLILPKLQTPMARQHIVESILQCVTVGKLAAHPVRTGSVRDNRGETTEIAYWICIRPIAKLPQLRQ